MNDSDLCKFLYEILKPLGLGEDAVDTVSFITRPALAREAKLKKEMNDRWNASNASARVAAREAAFWRKIVPPLKINNDELDRSIPTNLYSLDVTRRDNLPAPYRDAVNQIRDRLELWDADHGAALITLAEEWAAKTTLPKVSI